MSVDLGEKEARMVACRGWRAEVSAGGGERRSVQGVESIGQCRGWRAKVSAGGGERRSVQGVVSIGQCRHVTKRTEEKRA